MEVPGGGAEVVEGRRDLGGCAFEPVDRVAGDRRARRIREAGVLGSLVPDRAARGRDVDGLPRASGGLRSDGEVPTAVDADERVIGASQGSSARSTGRSTPALRRSRSPPRARVPPTTASPAGPIIPSNGANARHCGRTRVASPIARPAATHAPQARFIVRRRTAARAIAMINEAATPSVITAAVYGTNTG